MRKAQTEPNECFEHPILALNERSSIAAM
jgi:hypothetical protein